MGDHGAEEGAEAWIEEKRSDKKGDLMVEMAEEAPRFDPAASLEEAGRKLDEFGRAGAKEGRSAHEV